MESYRCSIFRTVKGLDPISLFRWVVPIDPIFHGEGAQKGAQSKGAPSEDDAPFLFVGSANSQAQSGSDLQCNLV